MDCLYSFQAKVYHATMILVDLKILKQAIETIGHTYLEIKPLCSDYKIIHVLGRAIAVVTVLLVK